MSIKHAILGLIAEEPMHGYRLKETFDRRISALWGLTTAQIYQTLRVLERAGLLTSRGERVGNRPARRIYSLTDAGKRALNKWLGAALSPWIRPVRADVLVRLMFMREPDIATLWGALDRQEQEVLHLRDRVASAPRRPRREAAIDLTALFLDGMAHHIDADLALLRRCREELAKWSRARKLEVPTRASCVAQRGTEPAPSLRERRAAAR